MAICSRIAFAEVIPYWLPFRREYVTARGQLERREMVLLRLVDEEGREGWGEGVPLSLRGGTALSQVVADLEAWASQVRGRHLPPMAEPLSPTPGGTGASAGEPGLRGLSAPARCAILTARADLAARRQEIPLWRYLGAGEAGPVPCNATLVSGPPAAVAADAESWAADGFTTFKLKVGLLGEGAKIGPDDPDLAQVEAVRAAVGPQARLRLDANGVWSLERAEAVLVAADRFGIELVEQPVADLAGMAQLRRRLRQRVAAQELSGPIAIAADESVMGPEQAAEAVRADACDLATVKLSKTGQLRADLGGALPFYLSSALDGPVGIAAAAHAYQAIPPSQRPRLPGPGGGPDELLDQGLATRRLFAATVASRECELRGAELHLPTGPGLGVEIDRQALAAQRL